MKEPRYIYATYRSFERAEAALEHMFACDDLREGDRPEIERRRGVDGKPRYDITLPMG